MKNNKAKIIYTVLVLNHELGIVYLDRVFVISWNMQLYHNNTALRAKWSEI